MTDKQIIIDGMDVSGCPYYCGHDICKNTCHYFCTPCEWVQIQNCMYKYGKRKEQECERWKEERDTWHFQWEKRYEICECLSDDIDKLCEQRDQLKAENDKYSLFIEKLCDYAGLECDDEEQAMRTLSDLASQMNKARWIIDRYKQTLTEIKEIAEKHAPRCNYNADCDYECEACHLRDLKQILQKISECEVNNDR